MTAKSFNKTDLEQKAGDRIAYDRAKVKLDAPDKPVQRLEMKGPDADAARMHARLQSGPSMLGRLAQIEKRRQVQLAQAVERAPQGPELDR